MARKYKKDTPKRDFYQEVTDKVVAALERGVRPWQKSWTAKAGSVTPGLQLPLRFNGEPYSGVNVIVLWSEAATKGFSGARWMTFKQALDLGGAVRRGEKGSPVVYAGKIVKEEETASGETRDKVIGFFNGYIVFNTDQIDNLPAQYYEADDAGDLAPPVDPYTMAAAFFEGQRAEIVHDGNQPMYQHNLAGSVDRISMPFMAAFKTPAHYYSVLSHEFTHWTGFSKRLDRLNFQPTKAQRAKEELIAEMGAAFLCAFLHIDDEPRDDHAAYLAGWLKALRDDKRYLFQAASAAQKAVEFMKDRAASTDLADQINPDRAVAMQPTPRAVAMADERQAAFAL
tara:strand:+ start:167 stop:1189 length:1023 start_codon:yes stop_codon:yes gene_type:complete